MTTAIPVPPRTGSGIVALNWLARWCQEEPATLLTAYPSTGIEEAIGSLLSVRCVGGPGWARRKLNAIAGLFALLPPRIAAVRNPGMTAAIRRAWATNQFEAVAAFEPSQAIAIPEELRRYTVLNIEDPPSLRCERMRQLPSLTPLQRRYLLLAEPLLRRFEDTYLSEFGRVLVLSPADADDMRRRTGLPNLGCVRYGVGTPHQVHSWDERLAGEIVISGNMFHWPNVDGVLSFLEHVFPSVLAREPTARLTLVGARPNRRIIAAAKKFGSAVRVLGAVADIGRVIGEARVSVCPIRLAIGVQTKVLEGMAQGTPVVSTVAGNSGIGATPGVHAHVDDTSLGMAAKIVALLRREGWDEMSRRGRGLVGERFSWELSAQAWRDEIRAVASGDR